MKRLTCEMCGSNQLLKQDNQYVCQSCGASYTTEEARKLLVDVPDTGNNSVKASNTYKRADERVRTAELLSINKVDIGIGIFLSIVTCGIYGIYWEYLMVKNIRALKHDKSSCTNEMLCLALVPFYSIYWFYTRGKFVNAELSRRKDSVNTSEVALLVLSIFGLDLVALAIMQTDFNSLPTSISAEEQSEANFLEPISDKVILVLRRILPDNVLQKTETFEVPMYLALSAVFFFSIVSVITVFSVFYDGVPSVFALLRIVLYVLSSLMALFFYRYTQNQVKELSIDKVPEGHIAGLKFFAILCCIVTRLFLWQPIFADLLDAAGLLMMCLRKKQGALISVCIALIIYIIQIIVTYVTLFNYIDNLVYILMILLYQIGDLVFILSHIFTAFALIGTQEKDTAEE